MQAEIAKRIAALATLVLALVACTVSGAGVSTLTTAPLRPISSGGATPLAEDGILVAFDSCRPFLDYLISNAVELVGPYGLEQRGYGFPVFLGDGVSETEAADDAGSGRANTEPSFSETNNQVEGVDEPDIVKTDGERIVLISEGQLIVAGVTASEPEILGRLPLGNFNVNSLFLTGDTVLLFGSEWRHVTPPTESEGAPVYSSPTVRLVEVDISGDPEIIRTMTIDGQFVSGRMIGDTVRLVMASGPVGFEWSYPKGHGLRAERRAVEENRKIIRNSSPENWVPYFVTTDADGDVIEEGVLFPCERASHPSAFSGHDMLSVITLDLDRGMEITDATGVLASGQTVYATADNLYVATQNWSAQIRAREDGDHQPEQVSTEIHKFDTSDNEKAEYVASGAVSGYLLNQFAMDEHEGYLRVASTTQPIWWGGAADSESLVTVLAEEGGSLSQVGMVDGLGVTEQIYSVRFMGDVGYVVTFRQTDPLYTVDLSDPFSPEVVGELKILGYSAYLHPVGEGLLMGIGQDATEEGRIQGTQVSIFDVSDLSDPARIDQITLAQGSQSEIEYDHHAFLYWEPTGLAMVPVSQWWWDDDKEETFFGAVGFEVEADGGLKEVQRVSHPGGDRGDWDWRTQIMRSIVVGDHVYTISAKGIMKSELDDLDEVSWLGF